jgi:hypothetical protein
MFGRSGPNSAERHGPYNHSIDDPRLTMDARTTKRKTVFRVFRGTKISGQVKREEKTPHPNPSPRKAGARGSLSSPYSVAYDPIAAILITDPCGGLLDPNPNGRFIPSDPHFCRE